MNENIISLIVNKLGDSSKKIQCHTIFVLINILKANKEEIAEVLIREVQIFISRPGVKPDHIYYAVAYLNKVASIAGARDEKVKVILFKIFMGLFQKLLAAPVTKHKSDEKDKRKVNKNKRNRFDKREAPKEIPQENNKVADIVLKGVNILINKCQILNSDVKEV